MGSEPEKKLLESMEIVTRWIGSEAYDKHFGSPNGRMDSAVSEIVSIIADGMRELVAHIVAEQLAAYLGSLERKIEAAAKAYDDLAQNGQFELDQAHGRGGAASLRAFLKGMKSEIGQS